MSEIPNAFSDLGTRHWQGLVLAARSADPSGFLVAARQRAGVIAADHLATIAVTGSDGADFLHRLSSQDTAGMEVGNGAPACFLTGKGKLLFDVRIWRTSEDRFVIEVDRHRVDELLALLDRFLFAEQVAFEDLGRLGCVAVVGPNAVAHVPGAPEAGRVNPSADGLIVHDTDLGIPCVRVFAAPADLDRLVESLDVPRGGFDDWEALRIDAGRPRYGVDANESTIPLEVGLDDSCHPEKGCYVGQEVIARIHTYGHVNRKLVRVGIETDTTPEVGTLLYDEDLEAGRTTSAYVSPEDGRVHALALLPLVVLDEQPELRLGGPDGPRVTLSP